ncbi:hypothetical protein [Ferrovibrio sp.]|uniref:hypothetical protein n=1 Tax=Ferrovibrio sp. TaxID=1917215 RepID=UPI002611B14D|nr:hypothetical protein [Ferrovibrio sp.]
MVTEIARNGTPKALLAARDALTGQKTARPKTEAERKLDEILQQLQNSQGNAAREAARWKLDQAKIRLEGLKLAAGSAAAMGDARMAGRVARDIRDAARDISRALADAGGGVTARIVPQPLVDAAQAAAKQNKTSATGNDLATLQDDAAVLLKDFRKIMRRLRLTGMNPDIQTKERAEMGRLFAAADRELVGLRAAVTPRPGRAVDLSA